MREAKLEEDSGEEVTDDDAEEGTDATENEDKEGDSESETEKEVVGQGKWKRLAKKILMELLKGVAG